MSTPALSFLASDSDGNLVSTAKAPDSTHYVIGSADLVSIYEKRSEELIHAIKENPGCPLIVPLNESVRFDWQTLSPDLAILLRSPFECALVVLPNQVMENLPDANLWKHLVESRCELTMLSVQMDSDIPGPSYPELAPQHTSMPSWLAEFIRRNNFATSSNPDAIAVKAGLFQIHDELDISHDYSQDCQGEGHYAAGDYWHGIMHRREPDYGNSKYWFRRVGQHPIFDELASEASEILTKADSPVASQWLTKLTQTGWDPFTFVDLCETCQHSNDHPLRTAAKKIQWKEMLLLLQQTHHDAN